MRPSYYCPRLKLSFWLRDMKERREVEKARKNMQVLVGLFPSLVLFFPSFIRATSLVNYLNTRNGLFFVCYWSLDSNLNTPINFRAGHPRNSLLHSRFYRRHAKLLPTKWGGALRDDSKNGCVGDYPRKNTVQFAALTKHFPYQLN